jgi:hypothetical protein
MTFHLDSGRVYHFAAGQSLALDIRTAGPFAAGTKPSSDERRARAFISPDFLGIGLDETCRAKIKLHGMNSAESPSLATGSAAAPVASSASPKPVTLSEEQERAILGCMPALGAFLQGIQNTPGLSEILSEMIERPSLWSIVRNGGRVEMTMTLGNDSAGLASLGWAPPTAVVYRLSPAFSLNKKPMLNCSLYVVAPRPPVLTTAGILGVVATSPGSKNKRLDIRVLAALRGAGAP